MTYYEIYFNNNKWEIWEWTDCGTHARCLKVYKTKKSAERWAAKQWLKVTWR